MLSRIVTGAALTGMLLATGCGGGSGTSPVGPQFNSGPGPGASSAKRGGTVVASFLVPIPRSGGRRSSSAVRKSPQYVSPGSSGIQVLLGSGAVFNSITAPLGQQYIIGTSTTPSPIPGNPQSYGPISLASTVNGYTSAATVSYSYAKSTTAGYYTLTVQLSGLAATTAEYLGVVLTDITNSNKVLSEGTSASITVPALTSPAATSTINLSPVLAGGYLSGGTTAVTSTQQLTNGPQGPVSGTSISYEFGAYAADELGYVIPYQTGQTFDDGTYTVSVTSTNASSATVKQCNTDALDTFGVATVLNPIPPACVNQAVVGTTTASSLTPGETVIPVSLATNIAVGSTLTIDASPLVETVTVTAVSGTNITVTPAISLNHASGATVASTATATNFLTATSWSDPGTLISNLNFSQSAGAPTLATAATGYKTGHSVNISFAAAGTYTISLVSTSTVPSNSAPSGLAGYSLTSTNYPTAGSHTYASTTITVPTGITATVQ